MIDVYLLNGRIYHVLADRAEVKGDWVFLYTKDDKEKAVFRTKDLEMLILDN